jgi:hypothetical protein
MVAHLSSVPMPLAPSPLSAGYGLSAQDEMIDLNRMVCAGRVGSHCAYEVKGSSCEPYIMPGSIVIVNRNRQPNNGDTVAVQLNDDAFVKIFERRESTRLWLVSPNKEYPPQEVKAHDDFEVLGVVEWAFAPVIKQSPKDVSIHHFQEVSPADGRIKAVMADQNGNEVHLNLGRDEVMRGIKMATKALSHKLLKFTGGLCVTLYWASLSEPFYLVL